MKENKIHQGFYLSIFLLPYFCLLSQHVNVNFLHFLPILLFFDLIIFNLNRKSLRQAVFLLSTLFFYSLPLYDDTQIVIHNMRFRHFFILFTIFTFIFTYVHWKYSRSFYFLNIFLILFTGSFFVKDFLIDDRLPIFDSSPIQLKNVKAGQEPVILIILDEYASPDELYKLKKDKSFFEFDSFLKNSGWHTHSSFQSLEKFTLKSLPSIFNFNLSKDNKFQKIQSHNDKLTSLVHENKLINSIKNINIYNYGLIGFNQSLNNFECLQDFNPHNTAKYLSFLPYDFGNFFGFTLINILYSRTRDKEKFKINVIDNLERVQFKKNSFYYFHLYAPHPPYSFLDEFPLLEMNTESYISFWKFTNMKIKKALSENKSFKNAKIIITGDHGFREDSLINYKNTYGAFYGFKRETVDQINIVQDLGVLILNSFRQNNNN